MPPKRALVAVHDAAFLEDLVRTLQAFGTEVVATTANAKMLAARGVPVKTASDVTLVPPILGGRVETLDARVHAGIVAPDDPTTAAELVTAGAAPFDLVAVNLPPLARVQDGFDALLASVDLQHIALIRSAATSYARVVVLVDPRDYGRTTKRIMDYDDVPITWRRAYAIKALSLVARYDAGVGRCVSSFDEDGAPRATPLLYTLVAERACDLRFGDNPQQPATLYASFVTPPGTLPQALLYGTGESKVPSAAQLRDVAAAMDLVAETPLVTFAVFARGAPIVVASAESPVAAFAAIQPMLKHALSAPVVVSNRKIDLPTAAALVALGVPCIAAPAFETEATDLLEKAAGVTTIATRALLAPNRPEPELFAVPGGVVLESRDATSDGEIAAGAVVSQRKPTEKELRVLDFAWKVAKHTPSDAVVVAREDDDGTLRTLGIAAAAPSRHYAVQEALGLAGPTAAGAVLASDGPIDERADIDAIMSRGVLAVAHPGSANDAQNVSGGTHVLALVATGVTHYRT